MKIGKEEEARARADLRAAIEDMADRRLGIQDENTELQRLNDSSRPLEGTIVNWHHRAIGICEVFRALCPISAKSETPPRVGDDRTVLGALLRERAEIVSSSTVDFRALSTMRSRLRIKDQEIERERERARADEFRDKVQQIRLILASVANYWIPMFMGLLGALAFILRSLTIQLRDHTYVPASASVSIIRMCLGAVAGVFGSMLAPGTEPALKSLPPLFIPFVFGYGIEILFSLMDRVVESFTRPDNGSGGKAPA